MKIYEKYTEITETKERIRIRKSQQESTWVKGVLNTNQKQFRTGQTMPKRRSNRLQNASPTGLGRVAHFTRAEQMNESAYEIWVIAEWVGRPT